MKSLIGCGMALAMVLFANLAMVSSVQAQPVRPVMDLSVIEPSSLPTVKWQPWPSMVWGFVTPKEMPKGGPAQPELALIRLPNRRVRLTLQPTWQGDIFHSGDASAQQPVQVGGRGGALDKCGRDGMVRPLRFDGVSPRKDGGIDYLRGFAWFNGHRCAVHSVRRRTARAMPLLGGRAFAFISHCDRCKANERDALQFIRTSVHRDIRRRGKAASKSDLDMAYLHLTSSLAPGHSKRLAMTVAEPGKGPLSQGTMQVVVEVSRGSRDAAPSIIAYRRDIAMARSD